MDNRFSPRVRRAAGRARWLAELAAALDEASRLTLKMSSYGADSREAIVLRAQILALRTEVDALRQGRTAANDEINPKWMI